MQFPHHFLERLQRACGHAETASVDRHRLEVDVLAALAGDVGVAARLAKVCALAGQITDSRHNWGVTRNL